MHVSHQRRIVLDTEVAVLDIRSPSVLDEVCELRVPYVFTRDVTKLKAAGLDFNSVKCSQTSDYLLVHEMSGNQLTSSMKEWRWFADNVDKLSICANPRHVLTHSVSEKVLSQYESFWRPYMCVYNESRLLIGGGGVDGYRSSSSCRRFVTCLDGVADVRLVLPRAIDEHMAVEDGQDTVCRDPDLTSAQSETVVTLKEGDVLGVPPYWWYAVDMKRGCLLIDQQYRSLVNVLANLDTLVVRLLKRLNVRKRLVGKTESSDSTSESVLSSVGDVE